MLSLRHFEGPWAKHAPAKTAQARAQGLFDLAIIGNSSRCSGIFVSTSGSSWMQCWGIQQNSLTTIYLEMTAAWYTMGTEGIQTLLKVSLFAKVKPHVKIQKKICSVWLDLQLSVLVDPNFFHMENNELLETINAAEFFSSLVQICVLLQLCLWALGAVLLTSLIKFLL